jgi:hypothetical protein
VVVDLEPAGGSETQVDPLVAAIVSATTRQSAGGTSRVILQRAETDRIASADLGRSSSGVYCNSTADNCARLRPVKLNTASLISSCTSCRLTSRRSTLRQNSSRRVNSRNAARTAAIRCRFRTQAANGP